jgi:hypothetical protein
VANQNFRVKTGLEVGTGVTISAGVVTAVNLSSQQINISGVSTLAGITTVTGVTLFAKQLSVSGVSTFQSDVKLGDSDSVYFGDNNNLRIFNDGSNSYISDQGIGNLVLLGDSEVWIGNTAASEYKARFITDGAVELYYDTVKKFETIGYGATVFGTLQSQGLQVSGISTLGNTIVGGGTTQLIVNGDARITGILTIGTSSVTFDGINNTITVGTAATINASGFTGSGANLTSLNASHLSSGTLDHNRLGGSGTRDSTTFLRGDNTWQVVKQTLSVTAKSSSYDLTSSDVGSIISISSGDITVPQNTFNPGETVLVYNNSSSSRSILQGTGTTLRLPGTADTGNRTVQQRGLITILCIASNEFIITGSGLL